MSRRSTKQRRSARRRRLHVKRWVFIVAARAILDLWTGETETFGWGKP